MTANQNPTQARPPAPPQRPPQRSRVPQARADMAAPLARRELLRIEAASRPWWSEFPAVALKCLELAFLPLRWLAILAEAVVSIAFVSVGIAVWLWWSGRIPDSVVVDLLARVGARLLAIVGKAGFL